MQLARASKLHVLRCAQDDKELLISLSADHQ
jgi:hypothetical protein